MYENSENQTKKKQQEDRILTLLEGADTSLLENEQMISELKESNDTSKLIAEKIRAAKISEDRIRKNRMSYSIIGQLTSALYFSILKLRSLNPMYEFSLDSYITIFNAAIIEVKNLVPKNKGTQHIRIQNILDAFKRLIYKEINRSLFVKHKMIFSFMVAMA